MKYIAEEVFLENDGWFFAEVLLYSDDGIRRNALQVDHEYFETKEKGEAWANERASELNKLFGEKQNDK